jgi:hypothetical protein
MTTTGWASRFVAVLLLFFLSSNLALVQAQSGASYGQVLEGAKKEGKGAPPCLDVDTKTLRKIGVLAAKDVMSLHDYLRSENQSEEKLDKVREPALKVAQKLLH